MTVLGDNFSDNDHHKIISEMIQNDTSCLQNITALADNFSYIDDPKTNKLVAI
jgi:hypothetical protein